MPAPTLHLWPMSRPCATSRPAINVPASRILSGTQMQQRRAEELVRVDRWGNIRRDGADDSVEVRVQSQLARRRQLALAQEREGKWVKMVANWDRAMRQRSI